MLGAMLSGSPQSRGQAFKTDNQKRSYGFKAKHFTPFCLLPCNKNTVFQHFYLPVGEGSKWQNVHPLAFSYTPVWCWLSVYRGSEVYIIVCSLWMISLRNFTHHQWTPPSRQNCRVSYVIVIHWGIGVSNPETLYLKCITNLLPQVILNTWITECHRKQKQ
jgi:hypothetical protein